jgi:hypothetical protein
LFGEIVLFRNTPFGVPSEMAGYCTASGPTPRGSLSPLTTVALFSYPTLGARTRLSFSRSLSFSLVLSRSLSFSLVLSGWAMHLRFREKRFYVPHGLPQNVPILCAAIPANNPPGMLYSLHITVTGGERGTTMMTLLHLALTLYKPLVPAHTLTCLVARPCQA